MKTLFIIAGIVLSAGFITIAGIYLYGTWIIIKDAGKRGEDLQFHNKCR